MDLVVLAEEWAKRLKSCEYAGEVAVPEPDLPIIAKQLRRELFSPRMTSAYRKCLLVLAINCMYYKHNEEGFWIHFCSLLDIADNQQSQNSLGEKLEAELLNLGLLPHSRPGPFRFVSPLREQCGITKHEIPRFALLLNHLTERHGWDGIRVLEREDFNQKVTSYVQGRHLRQFLLDDQGWYFTRDVARSVSQSQREVIDFQELENLHGYRTGFFHELFHALDKTQTLKPVVTKPPLPRLAFLPDFRQVVLTFDLRCCNARRYKINGEIVRRNPIPLDSENKFKLTINGERLTSGNEWEPWSIAGWVPSRSRVALFHMERGYADYHTGLIPGRYYMLAPFEEPPPIEIQLNSYGMVDLPFAELEYDAWLVLIEATTNLGFLGAIQFPTSRTTSLISWAEETNRIPGTYEIEKTFIKRLPPIKLLRTELFSSNAVGLFVEDGREIRRIKPSDIRDDKVHIDLPMNTLGRIWAEPISRMREFAGLDTLGELNFCLLPDCRIIWPDRLYSLADQPEVILVTKDDDISIELEEASPIDDNHRKWRIMPGAALAQGTLKSGSCEVPIAHRVFRADIHKKNEMGMPILFPSDFQYPVGLIVSGIPRTRAEIGLTDGNKTKALGDLGTFNEAGEISFSTFAMLDVLAGYKAPIGQFLVMAERSDEVRTNTLYINCDDIYDWLINPTSTTDVQWWSLLPSSIAEIFEKTLEISITPLKEFILPANADSIPMSLMSIFETFRCLCFVFDDSKLPDLPDTKAALIISVLQAKNPIIGETASWYVRAKQVLSTDKIEEGSDAEALLAEYAGLSWQPPFQRWKDKIKHLVHHLRDDIDVLPLIEEWKKDVERGFLTPTSRIASQSGGHELTHAWVSYRANNLHAAVTKAMTLINGSISSPIADLTAILVRVCWFRLGYFKSQPKLDFISTNKKLLSSYSELVSIIGFADWTKMPHIPVAQNFSRLAEALPLSTRDHSVFKLFAGAEHDWQSGGARDWLECYCKLLLARALNMTEITKQIARSFHGFINNVPASPDKILVIEIMEKCL